MLFVFWSEIIGNYVKKIWCTYTLQGPIYHIRGPALHLLCHNWLGAYAIFLWTECFLVCGCHFMMFLYILCHLLDLLWHLLTQIHRCIEQPGNRCNRWENLRMMWYNGDIIGCWWGVRWPWQLEEVLHGLFSVLWW